MLLKLLAGVLAWLTATAAATPMEASSSTAAFYSSISFSGNGCPQGHAPKLNGPDNSSAGSSPESLSFTFDRFRAASSPTTARTANCQAHINTAGLDAGWQLAVDSVSVTGSGRVAAGASLDYYATVFWSQKASDAVSLQGTFRSGDQTSAAPGEIRLSPSTLWSPCTTKADSGDILNVNFRIALMDEGASSYKVETERLGLKWRRC